MKKLPSATAVGESIQTYSVASTGVTVATHFNIHKEYVHFCVFFELLVI